MLTRTAAAAALGCCLALVGCQADDRADEQADEQAGPTQGSVEAFPDPPHVDGPLDVELRPALALMNGDRRCRPEQQPGVICSSDGSGGYRALGTSGPVVVDDVSTAPSSDHTSWETTVLFAAQDRVAVRRAQERAEALGGVVVVTAGDTVVAVLAPADLGPRRATLLGLQKAEAWAAVNGFSRSK